MTEPYGHSYTVVEVSPKCTTSGRNKCTRCSSTTSINALGHITLTNQATCTAQGGVVCTRSGCGITLQTIPATGHNYLTATAVKCATSGSEKCSKCNATKNIPATGHSFTIETRAATCELSQQFRCSNFGCTSTTTGKAALGHSLTTTNATCSAAGSKKCGRSGCSYSEPITKLEHSLTTTNATCSAAGNKKCGRSGCSYSETITKLEHSYGNWVVSVQATCTITGVRIQSCSKCGDSRYDFPDGHNYNSYNVCTKSDSCGAVKGSPSDWHYMFRGANFANKISARYYNYPPKADGSQGGSHYGIDIIASTYGAVNGMPVYSVGSGTVVLASDNHGYGQNVIIDNGSYNIYYAHFQDNTIPSNVVLGATVTHQSKLGNVGSTGLSDGPHLHFEIRPRNNASNGLSSDYDPEKFFPSGTFIRASY